MLDKKSGQENFDIACDNILATARTVPSPSDSYTVKRFLVIKYDAHENGKRNKIIQVKKTPFWSWYLNPGPR